jgi:glycerophosphoryl diester phosphodiesterase
MLSRRFASNALTQLQASWTDIVFADLFYKLLAFTVLTPLFSILLRGLLTVGGSSVLSDVDVAWFFFSPYGLFCGIVLGATWLSIHALEQASLVAILAARRNGARMRAVDSLRFAAIHAPSALSVSTRLMGISLLVIAPFLILAGLIYSWMLSEYDINYYLDERTLNFKIALGLGVALALTLFSILLRLASGWFIALPLVLFERVSPKAALRESRKNIAGNRFRIFTWLVVWLACGVAIHIIATIALGSIGWFLIPKGIGNLAALAGRVGLMLILITIVGTLLNLVGTIGFSLILFHAYLEFSPKASVAISKLQLAQSEEKSYGRILTRQRVAMLCLIGGLLAALIGVMAINSLQLEDQVEVMAHRGASKVAPENSLAAFRKAIEARADWIEIDVQETLDGEVVVVHDSDLMKLARNKIKIWEATLAQLQSVDIGSSFSPEFSTERVPTLSEVLTLCRGRIGVIIELKYYGHDQQLEQRVADIVEQHDMAKHVMVMSLKTEGIKKMKAIRPQWKCGVLMSLSIGNIQKFEADFLAVNAKFASRSLISRAHRIGKQVFVWTVDDGASMSMLMNRGVDGILTNRPELAMEILTQRFELSGTERLLIEVAALLGAAPESVEQ